MGMIKTSKEIHLIKKAASISNLCIKNIRKFLEEDITERELAQLVRKKINQHDATLSFQTLVGTGERSKMIHTKPYVTGRKISGLGYIDFGARYKGYCSDVTVPFIKGEISDKEKKVVALVIDGYKLAVNSVKIGTPCWKLFEKADNFFQKYGFRMQHSLGHGLGKKIHEKPMLGKPRKRLSKKKRLKWEKLKKITFQPGMIFTIEPAIYTRKFGCRIENDFLLTKNKLVKLTNAELIVV